MNAHFRFFGYYRNIHMGYFGILFFKHIDNAPRYYYA